MSPTVLTLILGLVIVSVTALPAQLSKNSLGGKGIKESIDSLIATQAKQQGEEKFSIANWQSPPELAEKFPYYLSGYDDEDRPIAVIDIGKWDARAWHKKGKEAWADLEHHAEKMLYILKTGTHAKNFTDEDDVTKPITDELGIIADFDGFNVAQMTSPQVLSFMTKYLGQLEILQDRIAYAYFINVNSIASILVRILKPVLGKAYERVEIYGTQKKQWMPILRRNLPLDQIPEKYGGNPGHKPLVFYG